MDTRELQGLLEAYNQIHTPQEVEEAVKGASRHDTEMRKADSAERRAGVKNRLSPSKGRQNADKMQRDIKFYDKITKKTKPSVVGMTHEEVDIFDVVLEFLQVEGYAETLEEAEWLMANVINEEVIDIILGEAIYSEKGKAKAAEMIANRSTPSGRAKPGKGANVAQIRQIRGSGRGDFDKEGLGGTPMTPTMAKNPRKKQNYTGTGNKAARRAGLTPTREKPNAWKEEYVDEAQVANRDPDKYEREQEKKYAPVRGEKTPMPPRGDKRREDFEKWYAKQMGR